MLLRFTFLNLSVFKFISLICLLTCLQGFYTLSIATPGHKPKNRSNSETQQLSLCLGSPADDTILTRFEHTTRVFYKKKNLYATHGEHYFIHSTQLTSQLKIEVKDNKIIVNSDTPIYTCSSLLPTLIFPAKQFIIENVQNKPNNTALSEANKNCTNEADKLKKKKITLVEGGSLILSIADKEGNIKKLNRHQKYELRCHFSDYE